MRSAPFVEPDPFEGVLGQTFAKNRPTTERQIIIRMKSTHDLFGPVAFISHTPVRPPAESTPRAGRGHIGREAAENQVAGDLKPYQNLIKPLLKPYKSNIKTFLNSHSTIIRTSLNRY